MRSTLSLMYHCVYSDDEKSTGFQNNSAFIYKISEYAFRKQVEIISKYLIKNKINLSYPIFTFDDGGVSFYENIAPILEKFDQRGLFFISTQYIGSKGFLTKEQIFDLYSRGHLIGSHSHSHPENMALLSDEEIDQEWKKSIAILSEIIQSKIEFASIPNGSTSKKVVELSKKNGIRYLFTSCPTTKIKDCNGILCLGRFPVRANMKNEYALSIVTNGNARKKLYFRWLVISLLKGILGKQYLNVRNVAFRNKITARNY